MGTGIDWLKNLLFFQEPQKIEKFIIKETETQEITQNQKEQSVKKPIPSKVKNKALLLNKFASKLTGTRNKGDESGKQETEASEISRNIHENMEYMKKIYSIPQSGDMILREFDITVKDRAISAFILFYDGMVEKKTVNEFILQPLMMFSNMDIKNKEKDVAKYVRKCLLPQNQLIEIKKYSKVIERVNFGACALFIDGVDMVFVSDVKGWEHRAVERPNTELVIIGPQEGFTELLRVNTALIRKIVKDEDLVAEDIMIGKRSKTPCSMMYIKDIANDSLVNEVRRRLESIKIDYIIGIGQLEQLIEDSTFFYSPQVVLTERPDRVASMLVEGKVAVVMSGSPFVVIVPATFSDLLHSSEDSYIRFPYANLLRIVRILGIILTILLPGLYVAITNYHHEMIPTDLLLAIEAAREKVPFPSVVEILIMEISLELIREAGIRIPGPIGPTLGIIGALILGQAAVAANIISPIMIIIVALTGIGSFAVPNYSLAFALRILRFGYIILGAVAGFLGITFGLFLQGIFSVSIKSFGIPMTVPFAPRVKRTEQDTILRAPMWKQEWRPEFLNTKDRIKQPKISRGWTAQDSEDKDNE